MTDRSKITVFVLAFLAAAFIPVALAQTSFDSALAHKHVATSTYEGVWIKRNVVPSQKTYPLGNQLAVRGATNELWFFYAFDPIKDGPLISMAEGTPSGRKVRVSYDPVCFYITKIEDLGAVLPAPTPPSPPPSVRESLDIAWPSSEAARSALWRDKITAEGWTNCAIYNNKIRCWRPRP